jgi:hypothetical protein
VAITGDFTNSQTRGIGHELATHRPKEAQNQLIEKQQKEICTALQADKEIGKTVALSVLNEMEIGNAIQSRKSNEPGKPKYYFLPNSKQETISL